MSGKEYAIRNAYGYVNYLDEDGIECLREHGETVDILGDAEDFRRMGYRSGSEAPAKSSTSGGRPGFLRRAAAVVGLAGAVYGADNSLASSALDPDPKVARGQITNIVEAEQNRERQRRSGHVQDGTRDAGNGHRGSGQQELNPDTGHIDCMCGLCQE